MKTTFSVLVAIAVVVGTTLNAQKPTSDIPLLVWLGPQTNGGVTSDSRQVTVGAIVADYASGHENVLAIVQSSGNFRLNMQMNAKQAAVRRVCVDFGTQLNGLPSQPLPLPYNCVTMEQPMHGYATGDVAIQGLRLNQQVPKLTRMAWTENGYRWRIGYGTDMDQNGAMDAPPTVITCIEFGQACTRWLMTPSTVNGESVLFRFKMGRGGAEGPAEFVANVAMPFNLTFQRQ